MVYKFIVQLSVVFLLCLNEPVMSSWEFAVTTKGEIVFYGSDWKKITTAAHQFVDLSAIAFDETEEIIYFNDRDHNNGSIFSLKLSKTNDMNHRVEEILTQTNNESVQGLAFDPLERILYWTDSKNNIIYQMAVDKKEKPKILMKLDNTKIPQGIAIDICRRKIYWTNVNHLNPSIERASMDGTKQEVLINSGLFMPSGIIVDQFSNRIYWVDHQMSTKYTVESANLDGTDRKTLLKDQLQNPFNLAVDNKNIYWSDFTYNAIWKISTNISDNTAPQKLQSYPSSPKGIIVRTNFLTAQENNPDCRAVINNIKSGNLAIDPIVSLIPSSTTSKYPENFCLNGNLNLKTGTCICSNEFKGIHCEIPICHNYCIEGTCYVTSTGFPQCTCDSGFTGERCEKDVCTGFCLNNGRCDYEHGEPVCHCTATYYGRRCENMNSVEICRNFCDNGMVDDNGLNLSVLCENCANNITQNHIPETVENRENYSDAYRSTCNLNKTVLFVSVGVVASLGLVFIIINSLRRIYKPIRPKIKKTYVVHKNVMQTPMTCRPTTEQCEITIEDCCNMNICDTPCFDPKFLQQEVSRESRKEDKKELLSNMEGDLY